MNQVTQTKNHLRREQWKSIIAACQSSDMTVKVWCEQNNVCMQSYYRNLRKFREELCDALPIQTAESKERMSFKKLELAPQVNLAQSRILVHLHSATLEVQEGVSQQTVETVLLALKSVC